MVATLLAAGATPNTADIDGVTPLGLACELGNADIVAQLLDAPCRCPQYAPGWHDSACHLRAVRSGRCRGADARQRSRGGSGRYPGPDR